MFGPRVEAFGAGGRSQAGGCGTARRPRLCHGDGSTRFRGVVQILRDAASKAAQSAHPILEFHASCGCRWRGNADALAAALADIAAAAVRDLVNLDHLRGPVAAGAPPRGRWRAAFRQFEGPGPGRSPNSDPRAHRAAGTMRTSMRVGSHGSPRNQRRCSGGTMRIGSTSRTQTSDPRVHAPRSRGRRRGHRCDAHPVRSNALSARRTPWWRPRGAMGLRGGGSQGTSEATARHADVAACLAQPDLLTAAATCTMRAETCEGAPRRPRARRNSEHEGYHRNGNRRGPCLSVRTEGAG